MTTNEYLRVQADLLIALDTLRRLPLRQFIEHAESLGLDRVLRDYNGLPVPVAECGLLIARCAEELVSHGPHARKPVASERGGAKREERAG